MNQFIKAHGLGNEYIVLKKDELSFELTKKAIKTLCNVHFGVGSDGILVHTPSKVADFGVVILNPDGSEAEKSGNGLRIFCKYLYDYGYTKKRHFSVETICGVVQAHIVTLTKENRADTITIDMGQALFVHPDFPKSLEKGEWLGEELSVHDRTYAVNCVSVGNPHCVVIQEKDLDEEEIKKYGPYIENHQAFPNRINVQFVQVMNRKNAKAIIWERGAGFTLASGSSSCAVASVLRKRGLVDNKITVHMLGGNLTIEMNSDWNLRMTGEVRQIAEGVLHPEWIAAFN